MARTDLDEQLRLDAWTEYLKRHPDSWDYYSDPGYRQTVETQVAEFAWIKFRMARRNLLYTLFPWLKKREG